MRFFIVLPGSLIALIAIAIIGSSRGTPEPQALSPAPEGVEEFLRRGELYEKAGSYEKALSDYEQAERLDPDNSDVYLGKGSALSGLEQPAAAIENYLIVKEIDIQKGRSTRLIDELIAREQEDL